MAEPGSNLVREAMADAQAWFICRVGFVETVRAIALAAGARATKTAKEEWPAFGIVEVDQPLVEHAAALVLDRADLRFFTWDRRLHHAATAEGMELSPQELS